MSFFKDYQFGICKEFEILPLISNYFKSNIVRSSEKFNKFDFYDDNCKYELKSRNNYYDTYPTTLIAVDKVINDDIIFLFKFMDGLYYIKYESSLFKTFEKKPFVRNQRTDYKDIEKEYFFIPIEKLTKIEN
jgi:hypothetical protein